MSTRSIHVLPLVLLLSVLSANRALSGIFIPAGLAAGDTYHLAFVTKGDYDGSGLHDAFSPDIAVYDTFVQQEAVRSGAVTENYGITWRVIGSTTTVDAKSHINVADNSPIFLLDGTKIADGGSDLWDGSIDAPLNVTQFGDHDNPGFWVRAGTGIFGEPNFNGPLGASHGNSSYALSFMTDGNWIAYGASSQATLNEFYAISEELTVPDASAVPEPSSFVIYLALAGCALATRARRWLPFAG